MRQFPDSHGAEPVRDSQVDRAVDTALDRVLAGEAEGSDWDLIAAWSTEAGGDGMLGTALRQPGVEGDMSLSSLWDGIQRRIDNTSVTETHVVACPNMRHRKTRSSFRTVAWIGGCLTVIAAAFSIARHTDVLPTGDAVTVRYATTVGERLQITLPDSSHVVLAPATELQYTMARDGERTVTLSGQAYFQVTHDPSRPFSVLARNTRTRILGTAFDVRAYVDDDAVEVAVAEGKVRVEHGTGVTFAPVVVTPGMVAALTDSSSNATSNHDVRAMSDWVNGRLVFSRVPVSSMLRVLGRWSGYEFQLADSALAAEPVTTSLTVGDPAETLRMLQDLLDVTLVRDGNVVILRPGRSRSSGAPGKVVPIQTGQRQVAQKSNLFLEAGR